MLYPERPAHRLEPVGCKTGAAVGQHMVDPEGEGLDGLFEEGDRTALGLVVLDRQVDKAGGPVDRDIQVPLAALAVAGAQLG